MIKTIAIRNPRILDITRQAVLKGVGRNSVEAAENMIASSWTSLAQTETPVATKSRKKRT